MTPLVRPLSRWSPLSLTLTGLVCGLAAATAIALGWSLPALGLWGLSRLFDGLDGLVARATGRQSNLGGYLDLMADFLVYTAIPLGLAWQAADSTTWMACAAYLGACYLNSAGWMSLATLLEKQGSQPRPQTSTVMPAGLIEGTESILIYSVFLLLPQAASLTLSVAAGLVGLSFVERLFRARRLLTSRPPSPPTTPT